jgi:hypothetical protein
MFFIPSNNMKRVDFRPNVSSETNEMSPIKFDIVGLD